MVCKVCPCNQLHCNDDECLSFGVCPCKGCPSFDTPDETIILCSDYDNFEYVNRRLWDRIQ